MHKPLANSANFYSWVGGGGSCRGMGMAKSLFFFMCGFLVVVVLGLVGFGVCACGCDGDMGIWGFGVVVSGWMGIGI